MVHTVVSQLKQNKKKNREKKKLWNHYVSTGACVLLLSNKIKFLHLGGENKNTNWAHLCFGGSKKKFFLHAKRELIFVACRCACTVVVDWLLFITCFGCCGFCCCSCYLLFVVFVQPIVLVFVSFNLLFLFLFTFNQCCSCFCFCSTYCSCVLLLRLLTYHLLFFLGGVLCWGLFLLGVVFCFASDTPKKPVSLQFQRFLSLFSPKTPFLQNPSFFIVGFLCPSGTFSSCYVFRHLLLIYLLFLVMFFLLFFFVFFCSFYLLAISSFMYLSFIWSLPIPFSNNIFWLSVLDSLSFFLCLLLLDDFFCFVLALLVRFLVCCFENQVWP